MRRTKPPMADAEAVLDASAVLAFLQREPGAELVQQIMPRALLCTINVAEIVTKLIDRGLEAATVFEIVVGLPYRIVDFDTGLALDAGQLWQQTRSIGLSLGDRACLALAAREGLPAWTTDQAWTRGNLGIDVRLIRAAATDRN